MATKKAEEKKLKAVLGAFLKVKPAPKRESKASKTAVSKTKGS
jgi:hypothetical protein